MKKDNLIQELVNALVSSEIFVARAADEDNVLAAEVQDEINNVLSKALQAGYEFDPEHE